MLRNGLDDAARRYYAPLVSFFRKRTRNASEVQDLVQQVFLRLSQQPAVEAIQNPDAYIFQTASNTLRDHRRRQRVRERFVSSQLDAADRLNPRTDFSPERVLLGREALALVAAAIRDLPERTRDVFILRCFEGLQHNEIARLYGISLRAVEKHAAKALGRIVRVLEQMQ